MSTHRADVVPLKGRSIHTNSRLWRGSVWLVARDVDRSDGTHKRYLNVEVSIGNRSMVVPTWELPELIEALQWVALEASRYQVSSFDDVSSSEDT